MKRFTVPTIVPPKVEEGKNSMNPKNENNNEEEEAARGIGEIATEEANASQQ